MLRRLSILAIWVALPLAAQPAPPPGPEVLATLIRQAHRLHPVDPGGTALPQGAVTGFLTRLIYELGVTAAQSDDASALGLGCDPAPDPGRWQCQVALTIRWGDAESAFLAVFDLVQGDGPLCPLQTLDGHGPYNPCAWAIPNDRIVLMEAG